MNRYGWDKNEFEQILQDALNSYKSTPTSISIVDITAPPGTGKTTTAVSLSVKKDNNFVATFPTHQSQESAFAYAIKLLKNGEKLNKYIIEYEGVNNYCIFYNPNLLKKFLQKFKKSDSDSYRDMVMNMFKDQKMIEILTAKGIASGDLYNALEKDWLDIAEALDESEKNNDITIYLSQIKRLRQKRGMQNICKSFCPLGLAAWRNRRVLYKALERPRIITHRREIYNVVLSDKRLREYIFLANTEEFINHVNEALSGENVLAEYVACPRYLITNKLVKRGKVPVFLLNKRFAIFTQHRALNFITNIIERYNAVYPKKRDYILFVDEYDSALQPQSFKLITLDMVRKEIEVANKVLEAKAGDKINDVTVTAEIKAYAKYVKETLTEVLEIVSEAISKKEYHPLVNIFLEGALSEFNENTLDTKVTYKVLGARVMHIKHFLKPKSFRLLQRILSPYSFIDLPYASKNKRAIIRQSAIEFNNILMKEKILTAALRKVKQGNLDTYELSYVATVDGRDVIEDIRKYLVILRQVPRAAYYYTLNNDRIIMKSVDVKFFNFLTHARKAILTTATSIEWMAYTSGAVPNVFSNAIEAVASESQHSLISFLSRSRKSYATYNVITYEGRFLAYEENYRQTLLREIKEAVDERLSAIINSKPELSVIEINIVQVAPSAKKMQNYYRLLSLTFADELRRIPPVSDIRDMPKFNDVILKYVNIISMLKEKGGTLLVLAQNKTIAKAIASYFNAVKCHGNICNDDVDKISHFKVGDKIIITWFRSRLARGIDIKKEDGTNYRITNVVVVGSPFVHLNTLSHTKENIRAVVNDVNMLNNISNVIFVRGYNKNAYERLFLVLTERDKMFGINELAQAIGRASRSVINTNQHVNVFIPSFLSRTFSMYSPLWLAT